MTFPVNLSHPVYTTILPSNRMIVSFRPFLEKERKILLMALESNSEKEIQNTIKAIIKSCAISSLDVDKMALIDIEHFFLQLRAKSIGEILNLRFRCDNGTEKGKCGNILEIQLDINDIKVENLTENRKIEITPNIIVSMNYPGLIDTDETLDDIEMLYDMIVSCIECVYDGENVYFAKDYKKEDLYNFITHLTTVQFKKMEEFIANAPLLRKKVDYTCKNCGFLHHITLEGLQSFFD